MSNDENYPYTKIGIYGGFWTTNRLFSIAKKDKQRGRFRPSLKELKRENINSQWAQFRCRSCPSESKFGGKTYFSLATSDKWKERTVRQTPCFQYSSVDKQKRPRDTETRKTCVFQPRPGARVEPIKGSLGRPPWNPSGTQRWFPQITVSKNIAPFNTRTSDSPLEYQAWRSFRENGSVRYLGKYILYIFLFLDLGRWWWGCKYNW